MTEKIKYIAKPFIFLYDLTLGNLGRLGSRIVQWIVQKCGRTNCIDVFAREKIIKMGQGEYIVFQQNGEEITPAPKETFQKAYKVLLNNAPLALTKQGKDCLKRDEFIQQKLQEIDPNLKAVFIPRTLYELIFVKQCIQEDLDNEKICDFVNPTTHKHPTSEMHKKCWHRCLFTGAGDNEHEEVKTIAYRLNKIMVNAFQPKNEAFLFEEINQLLEKEITFFKEYSKNDKKIFDMHYPGPTTNFWAPNDRGKVKPMGIRNEEDAKILRNAVALECSKLAENTLFIYRGSDLKKDSVVNSSGKEPYSLSYGSVFAGCIYDGGATAFHYMRNQPNAYAIPIQFDQLKNSPFNVPETHTVPQLYGGGEVFHSRTKAWKGAKAEGMSGIDLDPFSSCDSFDFKLLQSEMDRKTFEFEFKKYKEKKILLK